MTGTPEEALDRAREALRARREAGEYPPPPPPAAAPSPAESRLKLLEWAFVEPDASVVRSTRAHGAPITAAKRMLLRLVGQYLSELSANQTRFNLALVAHLERIEERIAALEAQTRQDETPDP
ncbi:MAG TPA: hypothetical protein VFN55_03175 [Solirubrobacteraceae bacterium]|nr:hypothetical protein [Solirubrobacteraceae bacterium]